MIMAQDNLGKEMDNLKEDMAKLRADLSQLGKTLLERGKNETDVAKDRAIEELKRELQSARNKGHETVNSVEQQIQEKPFVSLLIAFLAGLILGKMFERR
jgi:ElaB/YqjD/DUF883 family membrane-anchored ribosome-binding protein